MFVEKSGVKNVAQWTALTNDKQTKYVMTKNNQYRDNIGDMANLAQDVASFEQLKNNNRIQSSSVAINKQLAFGGVSRDPTVPHVVLNDCVVQDYPRVQHQRKNRTKI